MTIIWPAGRKTETADSEPIFLITTTFLLHTLWCVACHVLASRFVLCSFYYGFYNSKYVFVRYNSSMAIHVANDYQAKHLSHSMKFILL